MIDNEKSKLELIFVMYNKLVINFNKIKKYYRINLKWTQDISLFEQWAIFFLFSFIMHG